MPDLEQTLDVVLERARHLGFLGPGPLRVQVEHAHRFVESWPMDAERLVDLGSGGGLPALPLLCALPGIEGRLVERMERRAAFLHWAIATLGLAHRVQVLHGSAEVLAHESAHRHWADVVTARGFGPPSRTVEIALGFVRAGGHVFISEPPEPREWRQIRLDEALIVPRHLRGVVAIEVRGRPPAEFPRPIREQDRAPLDVLT